SANGRDPVRWPAAAQHAVAVGAVGVALLLRWLLDATLGNDVPYITVFPALLLLAVTIRPGPFVTASLFAWVGSTFLFVRPRFSLSVAGPSEAAQIALFGLAVAAAAVAIWLVDRRRRRDATELARQHDLQRRAMDAVPALIAYVDADLRYRIVNLAYLRWF